MTDPRTGARWLLGDKFDQVYPHLGSIDNLWTQKWKLPCERALYPFHDGQYDDFAPVFAALIQEGEVHDGYTDAYTRAFLPTAEALARRGDDILAAAGDKDNNKDAARRLYLRACAVYRIARFPYINSPLKREAYAAQKATYLKAAALMACPLVDVAIPHTAGVFPGDEGTTVPLYVRYPPDPPDDHNEEGKKEKKPCPAVLLMCGLDGHRPDNTARSDEFLARGWASVIVDIPGTADCPADRRDPTSPDRLWTSILDW